jgi:hypothetical protein
MTKIRFRAALAATLLAPALLAGCATSPLPTDPIPVEPGGGTGTTDPLTLSYPVLIDPRTAVPQWRALGEDFTQQLADWDAACVPSEILDDEACREDLAAFITTVNAFNQQWLSMDNSEWESGDYSGLVALEPTRDATIAARASYEQWGGSWSDDAPAEAAVFHADLTALDDAFTAWRG